MNTTNNNHSTNQIVSCIVPVLNEGDAISDFISSLHQQDYRPIELIIVDGGSVDGTIDIVNSSIDELNDDLFSIKLFHERDFGNISSPANARNIGLDTAQGEFIFFIDADTCFIDEITISTAVFECGNQNIIFIHFETLVDTKLEEHISKTIRGLNGIYLFRSSFIGKTRFIPTLGLGEDREFIHRIFATNDCSKIKACTITIGRHYPHTKHELKKQAEWYGRTIVRYLQTIWSVNNKDFLQQMSYTIYNVLMALFPLVLLISVVMSLNLTFVLILLFFAITLMRFFMYRLTSVNDFVFLMWYSIYYGLFFTKGLLLNMYKKNGIGRHN